MCDEHFEDDLEKYMRQSVSRRQFGAVSLGVGMSMLLPRAADAQTVRESEVDVTTPDGTADCYFVHPASGPAPAVLVWPDILGLRPAFRQMGKRLAESGYAVLVVNPFYRQRRAPVIPDGATFTDPVVKQTVFPMAGTLNATTHVTDARALVSFLDTQAAVDRTRGIGTIGYCMGGPMVMRTAGNIPERIRAAATFHSGALVTNAPDSPHLLIPRMKANVLIATAENDDQGRPTEKDALRAAFKQAGLMAEIEVYEGAAHGWCPPDSPVYNEPQAERAWSRMLALFKTALA